MKREWPQSVPAGEATDAAAWRLPLLVFLGVLAAVLWWYRETWMGMAAIWERSETFAHGWLIVPISLWLIWRRRQVLATLHPQPEYLPLLGVAGLGFAWLLGNIAGAGVVQQYAFTLTLPLLVWSMLGRQVASAILFPLGYLVLAVPFGEVFLPWLMSFTADFTVWALRLTGIPIYREGLFFTIPSGQWSVVEACSGLRYLIASFTLGTLYAYLTYRSFKRRLVFTLASVLVPIAANGVRAYMIVMIGHLSGMKLAVGVDHLIYGWLFFGLVMLLLFWIGAFWREDTDELATEGAPAAVGGAQHQSRARLLAALAGALLVAGVWPAYANHIFGNPNVEVALQLPDPDGWQRTAPSNDWHPSYDNAGFKLQRDLQQGGARAGVFIAYYPSPVKGKEMVSTGNRIVAGEHEHWAVSRMADRQTVLGTVSEVDIKGGPSRIRVWQRYWIAGEWVTSPYLAKWLQARDRLLGKPASSAVVMYYLNTHDDPAAEEVALDRFARAMEPLVIRSLAHGG